MTQGFWERLVGGTRLCGLLAKTVGRDGRRRARRVQTLCKKMQTLCKLLQMLCMKNPRLPHFGRPLIQFILSGRLAAAQSLFASSRECHDGDYVRTGRGIARFSLADVISFFITFFCGQTEMS